MQWEEMSSECFPSSTYTIYPLCKESSSRPVLPVTESVWSDFSPFGSNTPHKKSICGDVESTWKTDRICHQCKGISFFFHPTYFIKIHIKMRCWTDVCAKWEDTSLEGWFKTHKQQRVAFCSISHQQDIWKIQKYDKSDIFALKMLELNPVW